MKRFKQFGAVLNSEKFHQDLNEARALVSNLHTYLEFAEDFAWFLCAYPLSEGKKKAILKMDGKKKFGLLSRHLMGVSKKLGISDLYLSQYHVLKGDEKRYTKDLSEERWRYNWDGSEKSMDSAEDVLRVSRDEAKMVAKRGLMSRQLSSQTRELMEYCFSKYNAREDKINQLLEDE